MVVRKLTFRDKSGNVIKTGTRDVSKSNKITITSSGSSSSSSSRSSVGSGLSVQSQLNIANAALKSKTAPSFRELTNLGVSNEIAQQTLAAYEQKNQKLSNTDSFFANQTNTRASDQQSVNQALDIAYKKAGATSNFAKAVVKNQVMSGSPVTKVNPTLNTLSKENNITKSDESILRARLGLIDSNKTLNLIEKEQRKKAVVNQIVTQSGEKKDLFGGTAKTRLIDEKINKEISNINKNVLNELSKNLKDNILSVQEKARTGQSISQTQLNDLSDKIAKSDLSRQQLRVIKNALIIGSNLIVGTAYNFVGGVLTVGKELIILPYDATIAAYNYGKDTVKRAKKQKTKTINIYGQDLLKLNKKLFTSRQFIQNNPKESIAVLGAIAALVGRNFLTEFNKNPGKTLGKVYGNIVLPGKLGKYFSETQIGRVLQEAKFIGKQPKELRPFVREIIKASKLQENLSPSDIKKLKTINFNEVEELTKIEALAVKKTLQETDSFVFGSVSSRTISKGKTKIPKDVDLATSDTNNFLKTFKSNLPKSEQKYYTIKGQKIVYKKGNIVRDLIDVKPIERLRPNLDIFGIGRLPIFSKLYGKAELKIRLGKLKDVSFLSKSSIKSLKSDLKNGLNKKTLLNKYSKKLTKSEKNKFKKLLGDVFKEEELTVPTGTLKEIEGIKLVGFGEQTTRKGLGTLQVLLEKNPLRQKNPAGFLESLKIQLAALKGQIPKSYITRPLKKYTVSRLEKSIKILESKDFERLLNQNVPGITKNYPLLKEIPISKLKKLDKKKINQKVKQVIKDIKSKITKKNNKSKVPKSKVPKSKVPKSKVPKSKVPKSKVPKSKVPKSKVPKSKVPKSKVPSSKVPSSKVPSSKVPKSKVPSSKVPSSKVPSSKVPKSKVPSSKVPSSKVPIKTIPVPTEESNRIIKINFDSKRLDNKVLNFEGSFRERKFRNKPAGKNNPIITKKIVIRDTKNRALKKVANRVDNSLARSLKLEVKGIGKAKKDIKKPINLKKFSLKKSKNTPVLKLVEQPKSLFDTKGEKKEAKKQKASKPKSKKKTKPKVKVSKKKKKSR